MTRGKDLLTSGKTDRHKTFLFGCPSPKSSNERQIQPKEEEGGGQSEKILISVLALMLVIGLVGTGTAAYFSGSGSSNSNTFTAGTLSLQMSNDGTNYSGSVSLTWKSPTNWQPGENFTATVYVKNTGTCDATYLGIDWCNLQGSSALASMIDVTTFKEWVPGVGWIDDLGAAQHYQTLVGDGNSPLTLLELMQSYIVGVEPLMAGGVIDEFGNRVNHLTDAVTGNGYDTVPAGTPAIPAGGTYALQMGFTFDTSAGNNLQGAWCTFDVKFTGVQDLSQLP
jgi:predicted ribosomally synthesized peptide with SipW-like signal peptide